MTVKKKQNLTDFCILSAILLIIGILQGIAYPYPFLYPDSGAYVLGGTPEIFNIYRPMGYSVYLRILHSIVPSLLFIYIITYLLYSISTLALLFCAKDVLKLKSHTVFLTVSIISVLFIRMVFCCDFLMSDALFTILVNIFLTLALMAIKRKSILFCILELPVLWVLSSVRYSGMFILPICILSFIISLPSDRKVLKTALCVSPLIISLLFHKDVKDQMKKNTGVECFSPFGGWQLINNASVLFPEAKEIPLSDFKDRDLKTLHSFLCSFPDETYTKERVMTTDYMWNKQLPYKQFLMYCLQSNPEAGYSDYWVLCGQLYGKYAKKLILKYPLRYFTRFVIPSFLSTFRFTGFEGDSLCFKNEDMYRRLYGAKDDWKPSGFNFYVKTNPVRKVGNIIYWILFFSAAVIFIIGFRKHISAPDKDAFYSVMMIWIFIAIFVVMQAVSSPSPTWRYTMPFYLPSLLCVGYCVENLYRSLIDKYGRIS